MHLLPAYLETDRLVMRRLVEDDCALLQTAIEESLEHLRPWMPWISEEPMAFDTRRDMLRRWQAEWEAGGDSVLGIFRDRTFVGTMGLHRRVGPGGVEIGYWAHADHTGQGYITEAAAALTTAAFEDPGIERVEIHHDKANLASEAVPRRLGYTRATEAPDDIVAPAEVGIAVTWVVRREEWATRSTQQ